jgi:phosphoribosylanthranilate isomerase
VSVQVKVCGITRLADALAAVEAGADALGFVFYRFSPRCVEVAAAAAIIARLPAFLGKVGLFVNPDVSTVRQALQAAGLDTIQLHGEETPQFCGQFTSVKVIKALRIKDAQSLKLPVQYRTDAWLLDAFVPGVRGGTGATFNWGLAAEARKLALTCQPASASARTGSWLEHRPDLGIPIILAGGLVPENVGEAVRQAQPYGVDVSSGVESAPGKKDPARLRAFIAAAKGA